MKGIDFFLLDRRERPPFGAGSYGGAGDGLSAGGGSGLVAGGGAGGGAVGGADEGADGGADRGADGAAAALPADEYVKGDDVGGGAGGAGADVHAVVSRDAV